MFYVDICDDRLVGHIIEIVKPKKPENSLHVFAIKNVKTIENLDEYLGINDISIINYAYTSKIFLSDNCFLYSFINWYNWEKYEDERLIKIGGEDKTRRIERKCLAIQKGVEVLQDLKDF